MAKKKRSSLDKNQKQVASRTVFKKTVLDSGVRILTEDHEHARGVSCGIWITKGTRDEFENELGLAHFIEHLVFKRTKNRSAFDISKAMEAVGGDLNAYTSRENTAFVTLSLFEDLEISLDILSDLVGRPSFNASDIRKEKQVVIQEIGMSEDQLEDIIYDRFFAEYFNGSPLGRPILGTLKSIEGMKRKTIIDFHRRLYRPNNLIVSVAGRVDHEHAVKLVKKYLEQSKAKIWPTGRDHLVESSLEPQPEFAPRAFRRVEKKPGEQAHILVGLPSSAVEDHLRFAGYVINSLLGGGMTSRLYQSVREERGLVYSIYSQLTTYQGAGLCTVYAGTDPKKMPLVTELIIKELRRLKREGIEKKDVEFFKKQVKGSILLGAEDVENRMNSLAVNEMIYGRYRSVEDVMREVENVNADQVQEYIETRMDFEKLGIYVMGPLPEGPTEKWLKQI